MRIDKNPYGWSLDKENQKAKPADEPTESKVGFEDRKSTEYPFMQHAHTVCDCRYHLIKPFKVTCFNGD